MLSIGCKIKHCTLPKHRQECLCHTGSVPHQHFLEYGRIHVAQTDTLVCAGEARDH
jgi:hypothetical protein